MKIVEFKLLFIVSLFSLLLSSCSSNKSGTAFKHEEQEQNTSENTSKSESLDATSNKTLTEEADEISQEISKENVEEAAASERFKPAKTQQLTLPDEAYTVVYEKSERKRKKMDAGSSSSERSNEQLSVSSKSAQVTLFAKKIQKGDYTIGTDKVPYATVVVSLSDSNNLLKGALEGGTVTLHTLDSARITKGVFHGTLTREGIRYYIKGRFSNQVADSN